MLAIIHERQLVSVMNATKWTCVVEGIESLPFPPAFQLKLLTEDVPVPSTFSQHVTYFGDWQHLRINTYNYTTIEWLKIRPVFYRHVGQLLPDERMQCFTELQEMLEARKIPYELCEQHIVMKGYY